MPLGPTSGNDSFDAIVIGAGPNGLAAAITLARAGWSTLVVEAAATPGGGVHSGELTLPGVSHDICSAIYPFATSSLFLRSLPFSELRVRWIRSPLPVAHPLQGDDAAVLTPEVAETADGLGVDAAAYRRCFQPFVQQWAELEEDLLGPLRLPHHPLLMARFGVQALLSARRYADRNFQGTAARALFGGLAAHAVLPFSAPASAAIGLVLTGSAHTHGWPFPAGGAGVLAAALVRHLESLGGTILTNTTVQSLAALPRARAILFDTGPQAALRIAGSEVPPSYARRAARFRYGPGVFKIDWALSRPIPWSAPQCARAATVHVGGTFEEIEHAEREVSLGRHAERPYVLLAQHTPFDSSRAPAGIHTAWAYCHVPHGSLFDMTGRIEAQIERFAPGFRDVVLARSTISPTGFEKRNANLVGGDITGGANFLSQLFTRPVAALNPYRLGRRGLYLCSASTPPGAGVHGMCGYFAAQTVLSDFPQPTHSPRNFPSSP